MKYRTFLDDLGSEVSPADATTMIEVEYENGTLVSEQWYRKKFE